VSLVNNISTDLLGVIVGLILTLCIFSYIFGDNVLFRLGINIFIGVTAGYIAVVIWYSVILPQLIRPISTWDGSITNFVKLIIPLILSILLLLKIFPRLSSFGSPVMAFIVGAGAATIVGGAVVGTFLPQITASINLFDPQIQNSSSELIWLLIIESSFILIATLSTLIYFHFSARPDSRGSPKRAALIETIAGIGRFFIVVTFGALFAGVLLASISAFVERWDFIISVFLSIFHL